MKANQADHAVKTMCRVLKLSRSGYYAWLKRLPSAHEKRGQELTELVRKEYVGSYGIYGSPRIHAAFRREKIRLSRKRIARLMKREGVQGVAGRKFKTPTTKRNPRRRPAPYHVLRSFEANGPNELCVADITEFPTRSGKMYSAVILDVWSRKIVGWALNTSMPAGLVVEAREEAYRRGQPHHVVHHSDQGSQYTSVAFTTRCENLGVTLSMGSVGDCYDNAMAESFFATFDAELRRLFGVPSSFREAKKRVFAYIEGFYNHRRLHSSIGYQSPSEFEESARQVTARQPCSNQGRAIAARSHAR